MIKFKISKELTQKNLIEMTTISKLCSIVQKFYFKVFLS